MKRSLQFVAILVIAFLVGRPALASITCAVDPSPIPAACPMEMIGMIATSVGCPMSQNLETSGCGLDCCSHPAVASATAIAAPGKSRLNPLVQRIEQRLATPIEQPFTGDSPLAAPTFSSPPRYLLNQTFRI